jgi:benzoyl-CoA reductase/2-hydroxyglutaryl-CoA dehydratase subunit BcrC/BadD/HgdB
MLIGGILDDPEYLAVIEERGGLIVADSTCFGSRLFWQDVDEEADDPLRALARYYVADRPSCPVDAASRTAYAGIPRFRRDGHPGS